MTSPLKTPLWDFALDLYGRPGVSQACLTLQDDAGLDVIHVIVVAYADHIGKPLGNADIAALREAMKDWRAGAVLPLRAARRFLKTPLPGLDAEREALRETVKAAELKAEQLQLAMAHDWLAARAEKTGLPLAEALGDLLPSPQGRAVNTPAIQQALATIIAAVKTSDQA
ncbi:conserved hypothetical protein [Hyphomicrobiales bacterium]|nr:conserved hypothetical protein [Hyphomicrobiales bacterium]CAH1689284.1 conserved hypothetical protein [Hyphomicrobiales bacterium]